LGRSNGVKIMKIFNFFSMASDYYYHCCCCCNDYCLLSRLLLLPLSPGFALLWVNGFPFFLFFYYNIQLHYFVLLGHHHFPYCAGLRDGITESCSIRVSFQALGDGGVSDSRVNTEGEIRELTLHWLMVMSTMSCLRDLSS